MVGYHQDPQSLLTVADTNKSALWIKHWIFIVTNYIPTITCEHWRCLVMNHSKVSHIVLNDSYNLGIWGGGGYFSQIFVSFFCQHTEVMLFCLKLIKNFYMMSQSFQLITDFIHSIIENTKKCLSFRKGYPGYQEWVEPIISFSMEDLLSLYIMNAQTNSAC